MPTAEGKALKRYYTSGDAVRDDYVEYRQRTPPIVVCCPPVYVHVKFLLFSTLFRCHVLPFEHTRCTAMCSSGSVSCSYALLSLSSDVFFFVEHSHFEQVRRPAHVFQENFLLRVSSVRVSRSVTVARILIPES
jgi:hypothetical protein